MLQNRPRRRYERPSRPSSWIASLRGGSRGPGSVATGGIVREMDRRGTNMMTVTKPLLRGLVAFGLLALDTGTSIAVGADGRATGPLRVHRENPRYFDDGKGRA